MPPLPSCLALSWSPKWGCWLRASRCAGQRLVGHKGGQRGQPRSCWCAVLISFGNWVRVTPQLPPLYNRPLRSPLSCADVRVKNSRLFFRPWQAVVSAATGKSSSKAGFAALQAERSPAPAAPASAAAAAATSPASNGSEASLAQSSLPAAAQEADAYERLLATLAEQAAAPGVAADTRFEGVRALLAAAPTAGDARTNFARSLVGACRCAPVCMSRACRPAALPSTWPSCMHACRSEGRDSGGSGWKGHHGLTRWRRRLRKEAAGRREPTAVPAKHVLLP